MWNKNNHDDMQYRKIPEVYINAIFYIVPDRSNTHMIIGSFYYTL